MNFIIILSIWFIPAFLLFFYCMYCLIVNFRNDNEEMGENDDIVKIMIFSPMWPCIVVLIFPLAITCFKYLIWNIGREPEKKKTFKYFWEKTNE